MHSHVRDNVPEVDRTVNNEMQNLLHNAMYPSPTPPQGSGVVNNMGDGTYGHMQYGKF
jgi:hypothetical protein